METVVSGIRPTGKLHLGNYFGAVKNFIKMQEQFNCYFFIADYHSLTTHPKASELHSSVRTVFAEYLALGLDSNKSTLYIQSDLPEIPELYLLLNMNAYLGELERVASFKDKVRSQPDNVNAGLLTYPTLMTADIIIHKASKVPVGKDQEQHLELSRKFVKRFNHMYNNEYFPAPEAFNFNQELVKIPGLTGQGKMSKSLGEADCIYLSDDAKSLNKKIMRAVTDSGPTAPNMEKSESVQNLFDLLKLVSNNDVIQHFEEQHNKATIRYGDLKKQLAEDMEIFISPLRDKIEDTMKNDELIAKSVKIGMEKARESASQTIKDVREIVGLRRFY